MTRFPILLLTLALAGCADVDKLQQENQRLRAELMLAQARLASQAGEKAADHAYFDRQASIAAACDWIVPVCPSSLTATGHEAQAGGYGGGGWEFWLIVFFKFVLLASVAGAAIAAARSVWTLIGKPTADQVESARRLVSEARRTADEAATRAAVATRLAETTEEALAVAEVKLASLNNEVEQISRAVGTARDELARIEATKADDAAVKQQAAAALSVFRGKPK